MKETVELAKIDNSMIPITKNECIADCHKFKNRNIAIYNQCSKVCNMIKDTVNLEKIDNSKIPITKNECMEDCHKFKYKNKDIYDQCSNKCKKIIDTSKQNSKKNVCLEDCNTERVFVDLCRSKCIKKYENFKQSSKKNSRSTSKSSKVEKKMLNSKSKNTTILNNVKNIKQVDSSKMKMNLLYIFVITLILLYNIRSLLSKKYTS